MVHVVQLDESMQSPEPENLLNDYVSTVLIDLEVVYAKLRVETSVAIEELLWLQRQKEVGLLSDENRINLNSLIFSLRKNYGLLGNRPEVFFQTMLNEENSILSALSALIAEQVSRDTIYGIHAQEKSTRWNSSPVCLFI